MESVRFVGLDVHADSIAIAVAEPGRGEPGQLAVIANDPALLLKRLRKLGRVKCCYEAPAARSGRLPCMSSTTAWLSRRRVA
jgi:hypothetical protein